MTTKDLKYLIRQVHKTFHEHSLALSIKEEDRITTRIDVLNPLIKTSKRGRHQVLLAAHGRILYKDLMASFRSFLFNMSDIGH